jgi:dUTPase
MKQKVGLSEESGVLIPEVGFVIWTRPGSGLDAQVVTVDDDGLVDPDYPGDVVTQNAAGNTPDPYAGLR